MTTSKTVIALVLFAAAGVHANPELHDPVAQRHFEAGIELYKQDRFAESLIELRVALAIERSDRVLFALSQSARRAGDCQLSSEYARQLLMGNPPAKVAEVAGLNILECSMEQPKPRPREASPREVPTIPREAVPAAVRQMPAVAARPAPVERSSLTKKWWFWTAVGGGALALGLGVGLGVGLSQQPGPPTSHFPVITF